MRIFVGNLPFSTDAQELSKLFMEHGSVSDSNIVMDRDNGQSRGFGFVEMTDSEEAQNAIEALNGAKHEGRKLTVNEARPRPNRGNGGGHRRQS